MVLEVDGADHPEGFSVGVDGCRRLQSSKPQSDAQHRGWPALPVVELKF